MPAHSCLIAALSWRLLAIEYVILPPSNPTTTFTIPLMPVRHYVIALMHGRSNNCLMPLKHAILTNATELCPS
jgi:hypothetical protein